MFSSGAMGPSSPPIHASSCSQPSVPMNAEMVRFMRRACAALASAAFSGVSASRAICSLACARSKALPTLARYSSMCLSSNHTRKRGVSGFSSGSSKNTSSYARMFFRSSICCPFRER